MGIVWVYNASFPLPAFAMGVFPYHGNWGKTQPVGFGWRVSIKGWAWGGGGWELPAAWVGLGWPGERARKKQWYQLCKYLLLLRTWFANWGETPQENCLSGRRVSNQTHLLRDQWILSFSLFHWANWVRKADFFFLLWFSCTRMSLECLNWFFIDTVLYVYKHVYIHIQKILKS